MNDRDLIVCREVGGRVAIALGAATLFIAAVVQVGWAVQVPAVIQVLPSSPPMMPVTAVCLGVLALGLLLLQVDRSWAKRLGHWLGLVPLAVALVVLGEYVFGATTPLDTLLWTDAVSAIGGEYPGRPSPQTALTLVPLSIALMTVRRPGRTMERISVVTQALAAILPALVLLGYFYAAIPFFLFRGPSGMAISTSVACLMLSVGLVMSSFDHPPATWFLQSRNRVTIIRIALVTFLVPLVFRVASFVAATRTDNDAAVDAIAILLTAMTTALAVFTIGRGERRLSRSLADERDRFTKIFSDAPIGMALVDESGTILRTNAAWPAVVARPDTVGASLLELVPEAQRDRVFSALHHALTATESSAMDIHLGGADSAQWAEFHISALRDSVADGHAVLVQAMDLSERKAAELALQHQATHDPLTGLITRRELRDQLTCLLSDPGAPSFGLLYVDVDRFKEINDGLSHDAGDVVLQELAKRISRNTRSGDVVARVGGDEFVVVLLGLRTADAAFAIAQQLSEVVSATDLSAGRFGVRSSVSIGVTVSARGKEAEDVLREADLALNEAKRKGRNRVALFSETMAHEAETRLRLAAEIRRGLVAGEFHAFYQPIVDLGSGDIVGYEALARWIRSPAAVTDAETFIRVAEDFGLIVGIGKVVIDEAIEYLSTLPEPYYVAVNASPSQMASPEFIWSIGERLREAEVRPDRLVLEITEQALLRLGPTAEAALIALCDQGVSLFFDDFGTGFSSMTHLRDYPVAGVKLDKEFTSQLEGSTEGPVARLVEGIARLANHLQIRAIAEGVETGQQARALSDLGWRLGQGYLFGAAKAPMGKPLVPLLPAPRGREAAATVSSVDAGRRASGGDGLHQPLPEREPDGAGAGGGDGEASRRLNGHRPDGHRMAAWRSEEHRQDRTRGDRDSGQYVRGSDSVPAIEPTGTPGTSAQEADQEDQAARNSRASRWA